MHTGNERFGRGSENLLVAVACPQATHCTAVGVAHSTRGFLNGVSSNNITLIEPWHGLTWKTVTSPRWWKLAALFDLSRIRTECVAVGSYGSKGGLTTKNSRPVERQDVVDYASASALKLGNLREVSCPSPKMCMATGGSIAEIWHGHTWTVVPTPGP
jgi:hypothetical protein